MAKKPLKIGEDSPRGETGFLAIDPIGPGVKF